MFPLPPGEVPKGMELRRVPRNPVVIEMAVQDLIDHTGLLLHGLMHHSSESLLHRGFRTTEAFPFCLKHRFDDCLANAPGPINRETKKRQLAPFMGLGIAPGTQIGLMGLLFGKSESKLSQTRLKQSPHRVDVCCMLEEHAEVIRVLHLCLLDSKVVIFAYHTLDSRLLAHRRKHKPWVGGSPKLDDL